MNKTHIWKLHSFLGIFCGLGLLLIGLSGSVLVFHWELTKAIQPDWVLANRDTPTAERRDLQELIDHVEQRFPDYWVRGWLPRHDSELRDQAYVKRHGADNDWYILHVDPYTLATAPRPLAYRETIYGWFVELHYTFFLDHIGVAIAAVFSLAFIALGVTGIWIYRDFWKHLFRLRLKRSIRIFCSDLHKMVGILTLPINLILGITGAYWNISHVLHDLEHWIEGEAMDPLEHRYEGARTAIDSLMQTAESQWQDYRVNYVYFPTEAEPSYVFYGRVDEGHPYQSPYGSWVQLEPETGAVLNSFNLSEAGWLPRMIDAFEPLHFGEFGGITTKVLWCAAGLAPGILYVSGFTLWYRRSHNRRLRQQAG